VGLAREVVTHHALTFRDWVYPKLAEVREALPGRTELEPYCWESERYHGLLMDRRALDSPDPSARTIVVFIERSQQGQIDALKHSYVNKLAENIRVKGEPLGSVPFSVWVGGEMRTISYPAFRGIELQVDR
jgi:hypothetical protein